jgi:hypothetical protein
LNRASRQQRVVLFLFLSRGATRHPDMASSCLHLALPVAPSPQSIFSLLPLAFVSATSFFSHLFPFTAPIERQTYGHTGDRVLHLAWH